jgi:hypothetical protein
VTVTWTRLPGFSFPSGYVVFSVMAPPPRFGQGLEETNVLMADAVRVQEALAAV